MTVVLAMKCADGLVMAADTQVTDRGRGVSYPARKLHELGDVGAWGGSGARGVLTEIVGELEASATAIVESVDVARALQQRVVPVLRHHYANYIPDVPDGDPGTGGPSAYVLASGYSDAQPWIIQVDPHGMVTRYEDVGFHAIGSGAPMAQQAGALLAHFRTTERSVDHGVVAAVRVLDSLRVTSPSVGGELDVCRITPEAARHLDEDEVDVARERVARWTELEQGILDELLT